MKGWDERRRKRTSGSRGAGGDEPEAEGFNAFGVLDDLGGASLSELSLNSACVLSDAAAEDGFDFFEVGAMPLTLTFGGTTALTSSSSGSEGGWSSEGPGSGYTRFVFSDVSVDLPIGSTDPLSMVLMRFERRVPDREGGLDSDWGFIAEPPVLVDSVGGGTSLSLTDSESDEIRDPSCVKIWPVS